MQKLALTHKIKRNKLQKRKKMESSICKENVAEPLQVFKQKSLKIVLYLPNHLLKRNMLAKD